LKDVSIPIPDSIGPYSVVRGLAQGGMAAVFEVIDPTTGDHLAVKLLTHRGLAMPRFAREFRALARLDHPNIVRVYRYGSHEGSPYLTMELLDGQPVQAYAKSVGRPGRARRTREVLRITALMADALDYLHVRGIVHRDLKSANVLVLSDGRVKLLDFGTAHIVTGGDAITRAGEFVGTFAYASPEQITGGSVDARSDLYSLGALLYRLCTGKRVFEADSPHDLARKHLEKPPRPPRELLPNLPQPVEDLILRMLAKDPADRPQTAREVAAVIRGRAPRPEDARAVRVQTPSRLTGRQDELSDAVKFLDGHEPGACLFVTGPSGSGRGRLLRAAIAEARGRSWRVFDGRFTGKPGVGVLGELIESVWTTLPPKERTNIQGIAWLQAPGARVPGTRLTSQEREALLGVIFSVVRARQRRDGAPLVLGLHNLHRAAPLAVELVAQLRPRLRDAGVPVVVMASVTDEADAPGSSVRARFPDAARVHLTPLEPDEVGEMLHQMLGGTLPPPSLTKTIHHVTGGLPGYVEEVVRAMVQQGALEARQTGGTLTWIDRTGGSIEIPTSAREAITFRLDGMPKDAVRVLEALAVAGGRATVEILAFALDRDADALLRVLDDLDVRHMLRSSQEGGEELWTFRLGMTRELVLERLRASRRHLLRRRLADVVANADPGPTKIQLLSSAGQVDAAVLDAVQWGEPLVEWGRAPEVLSVLLEVSTRLDRARELGLGDLARFHLLLARALSVVRPADPLVEEHFRRAGQLTTDPQICGEVDLYHSKLLVARGELSQGRDRLNRAYDALSGDSPAWLRARVTRDLGSLQWFRGRFDEAENWFEESLSAARRDADPREVGRSLVSRAVADTGLGRFQAAEVQLLEASALFKGVGDRFGQWHCLGNLAEILRLQARFSEAIELLEPELAPARQSGDPERYAFVALNLAEVEVELMRLGAARERLALIEDALNGQNLHLQAAMGMVRARVMLASDDASSAVAVLDPLVHRCERAGVRVIAPMLKALLGEAMVYTHDEDAGRAFLDEAVDQLRRERNMPMLAEACAARGRALIDEDPHRSFGPVLQWIQDEPILLLRVAWTVAQAQHAERIHAPDEASDHWVEARALLRRVRKGLAAADKESLRVHPWTLAVTRGLRRAKLADQGAGRPVL
jgi:tetratricopeptide (TPR) repeat protein